MFNTVKTRPKAQWSRTFQSLHNRDYRLYVTGQLVSQSGTWMQNLALSWVAYKLTNSALALGLVQFAGNLPFLLFAYLGGMTADRFNSKRIIIVTQWLEILQAILVTVLYLTGHLTIGWLIGMAIYLGICSSFEVPARQTFIPRLVEKSQLTNAIGLNSAIFNFSRLIGPMLAGFIIASGGEVACFILNAASYTAAIVTLSMIKRLRPIEAETAESGAVDGVRRRDGAFNDSAAGDNTPTVKTWMMQRKIRNILMLVAVTSTFGFQYIVLLPLISAQSLGDHTGALLGFLSAGTGIGALFGSLVVAGKGNITWLTRRVGVVGLGLSTGLLLLALSHMVVLSMVATALCGFSLSMQLSGSNSLVQLQVPEKLRGRVMSVYSTFLMGLAPFAGLIAGRVAESCGVPFTLVVAAAVTTLASTAYLLRSR